MLGNKTSNMDNTHKELEVVIFMYNKDQLMVEKYWLEGRDRGINNSSRGQLLTN